MAGGDRKIGQNKRKPSNVAYKAQGRCERNKRRNSEKEAALQDDYRSAKREYTYLAGRPCKEAQRALRRVNRHEPAVAVA